MWTRLVVPPTHSSSAHHRFRLNPFSLLLSSSFFFFLLLSSFFFLLSSFFFLLSSSFFLLLSLLLLLLLTHFRFSEFITEALFTDISLLCAFIGLSLTSPSCPFAKEMNGCEQLSPFLKPISLHTHSKRICKLILNLFPNFVLLHFIGCPPCIRVRVQFFFRCSFQLTKFGR